jgi:hypothetical protein
MLLLEQHMTCDVRTEQQEETETLHATRAWHDWGGIFQIYWKDCFKNDARKGETWPSHWKITGMHDSQTLIPMNTRGAVRIHGKKVCRRSERVTQTSRATKQSTEMRKGHRNKRQINTLPPDQIGGGCVEGNNNSPNQKVLRPANLGIGEWINFESTIKFGGRGLENSWLSVILTEIALRLWMLVHFSALSLGIL